MASTITFRYRVSPTTYTRTFTTLAIRGMDDFDAIELWPPLQHRMVDGHIEDHIRAFRRIITVTLGVLQEDADRAFMLAFLKASDRWIYFGTSSSIYCVLADPEGFENEWKFDTSLMRYYDIKLRENLTHTVWPNLVEPTEDDLVYIGSDWIEITGGEATPTVLTTNAGVLATDATGNPYPPINLAAYAVELIIRERQSTVCYASAPTQSGADVTFNVWHADTGNPFTDGKFYCRITISLQAL